jgi:hypothetical protein
MGMTDAMADVEREMRVVRSMVRRLVNCILMEGLVVRAR